jgi:hypothetical protein
MAKIDPNWTLKFLLENPAEKDGVLHDHKAKLTLAAKADELDDDGLGEERKGPTRPVDELDDVP